MNAASWDSWEAFVERHGPSRGYWGFSQYAKSVKNRLAFYDCCQELRLHQDLAQQDELTTWAEYIAHEHWFFNQYTRHVSQAREKHGTAWANLCDSGVLRITETYEVVCSPDTAAERARERENAEEAVEVAAAACLHQSIPAEARSVLCAARAHCDVVKKRNNTITGFLQRTRGYRITCDRMDRHNLLLRWLQQQVPLVQRDHSLSSSSQTALDDHAGAGSCNSLSMTEEVQTTPQTSQRNGKRKRSCDAVVDDVRSSKRPRHGQRYTGPEPFKYLPRSARIAGLDNNTVH